MMKRDNKRRDLQISIETLIETKLSFEEYLVLYSLEKRDVNILIDYIENCKKLETAVYKRLEKDDYIHVLVSDDGAIYHDNISLTSKGRALFGITDEQFNEFRSCYPIVAKQGKKARRLQGNLKVCKELYKKLLLETTHEVLCRCAKLYNDEKISSGDQWYFQALEAWLRQKNYQMYLEDIDKVNDTGMNVGGFQDDI